MARNPNDRFPGRYSILVGRLVVPLTIAVVLVLDASPSLYFYDFVLPRKHRFRSSFQNQTIWVTGASSGIGQGLLCHLMEAQTKHVIISSRQQESLDRSVATCRSRLKEPSRTKVSIVTYDAASEKESAEAIVQRVLAVSGAGVDRVFLNAGMYQVSPAISTPTEYSRRVMKVNYESPTELAVALLQHHAKDKLHIVVVASILSRGQFSLVSSYTASKHALRAFFHSLASEHGRSGVRIDVACPAGTATELWNTVAKEGSLESAKLPLMTPERVAWLILTGATGPYALFWETWITGDPSALLWTVVASYMPNMAQVMLLAFGWCRMQFWERFRMDVADPFTLAQALFWKANATTTS